jgi:hypothetical protein
LAQYRVRAGRGKAEPGGITRPAPPLTQLARASPRIVGAARRRGGRGHQGLAARLGDAPPRTRFAATGDRKRRAQYSQYPSQLRVPGKLEVYQSMGISQIKWTADGKVGAGTEPLRWESTAFNADYQAATIRFYFDDPGGRRTAWGDPTFKSGNAWNSVGGWFSSYPWLNPGQLHYVPLVQARLAARTWAQPGF